MTTRDGTRGKRAIYRRNEAWYARPDVRFASVTKRSGVCTARLAEPDEVDTQKSGTLFADE